ncbi:MAG: class I SAM-dependent methyltransferase [Bacteriovoracia bacterium]
MYTQIKQCRICGNSNLVQVVDLGEQYLTGVFPKQKNHQHVTKGPLRLVKCHGKENVCGLLQLEHSYSLDEMYGDNYGYRSGLNASMVKHLHSKVKKILQLTSLKANDLVIDIGSNDGTSLGAYPENLDLLGVDPTGAKFRQYYKPHVNLIPDFFTFKKVAEFRPNKRAKVITSFSMLYDLEEPVKFAQEVAAVLDPNNGIWVFEQSYMPTMIERLAYDTICHEHLEYYGLKQIAWMMEKAGLKIVDVELNDVNGGSFSVVAANKNSEVKVNTIAVEAMLASEKSDGYETLVPYKQFFERIKKSREELTAFIDKANANGKKVYGLGASTKGNVVLQYCGFTDQDIHSIGEVNPDKFGVFAPGTAIPIQDEKEVLASGPDYLLVLPWHFRRFFLENSHFKGHNLLFPLPTLEVVKP